ncbi:MarR family winged helix-turn-helix transcriptional regulator [Salaquimonas pukyongi]|uniref:MarR family winged helix-turn-helix transcriptional regulator n=1 Tax=Salaquimonas pukyongi TaxID=2712698 RepID=UPI00096B6F7A|nr:MarR family transcriptional regulator [Salaquimonas pukyongi]
MRTSEAEALYRFYRSADQAARLMRLSADRLLPDGLSLAQFELLDLLVSHSHPPEEDEQDSEGLAPAEAARKLGLTRGSLTSLLNQLVARKLAVTRAAPRDRRSKRIMVTARGRALHRDAMIGLSGFTSAMLTVFSRDRFSAVQELLDEFIRWLETEGRLQSGAGRSQ